ncbi:MAG: DEAD/DEAH box helicase [bacterium]
MVRVDSKKACKLVYSLGKHPYLGFVIEPHIVQLNSNGGFSLTHRKLYTQTAKEFDTFLDDQDYKIIKLLDQLDQEYIIKKYHKEIIRPAAYFAKIWNDKLYAIVRPIIEKKLIEAIKMIGNKPLFEMGKEGDPVHKQLHIAKEPASVLFHFRRSVDGTRYFPTIKYLGERIEFMFKDAEIISMQPAYMLLGNALLFFDQDLDGKKLLPFLNKRFIDIPKSSESTYFKKFIGPLIERHNVYAEGFQIITEQFEAVPILKIVNTWNDSIQLVLSFQYGKYNFLYQSGTKVSVSVENKNDEYIFHRVKRSLSWEATKIKVLTDMGLIATEGSAFTIHNKSNVEEPSTQHQMLEWLSENNETLAAAGFNIQQEEKGKKYFLGKSKIDLKINESNDWFDVYAIVYFGKMEVPFIELKDHILNGRKEFLLPNGEIAIIPDEWFATYQSLFHFSESGKELKIKKHHIALLKEYADSELAQLTIDRKLQKLSAFENIDEIEMPANFKGELRQYQKAGYDWFHFLRRWNFGGCLADDMGLGKTIQTLALLQKVKEEAIINATQPSLFESISGTLFDQQQIQANDYPRTSLIVMPTSLIHNWLNEAKKFTPDLKIHIYTGGYRDKEISNFSKYDIVLTTYGITRLDIDILKSFYFHYIILDESQIIKNPSSKISRSVRSLKSKFKLVLSGTPVENSVTDLWSQMSFVNPGLLGSQTFFNDEFATPIDKKQDEEKANKLQTLIKPFILRRTKQQVASELPPKVEQLYYSDMSEEQEKLYEETKSFYRNELLRVITEQGIGRSHIQLLQGLNKLRQIANHPRMVDEDYDAESGKFSDVIYTLENILTKGNKVLIFSQFVKHLNLFKKYFNDNNINYSFLDGSTLNRQEVVEEFKTNDEIQIFLISIKAGGVGLNLTEADYVFILDPWWNPAVEQQAIDRTHRIGQKNTVFIYKFITKNSVEEKILALQEKKRRIADSLITTEESFMKSLSEDDIKAILE